MSSLGDKEIIPGVPYSEFVRMAGGCSTEAEFRRSDFYREHGAALERLLDTPQIVLHPHSRHADHGADRFRIVHWNIEKGKQLARIVQRLQTDPILGDADVYSFNEVDVGMARSGDNAHVPEVLAEALGCHYAYVPSYLECTKGPNEEALAPGENERGWHGLAVLSRHPIERVRVIPLPSCFDYYHFFEKRYGRRQALVTRLVWQGRPIEVITTHLEVRNTPHCRARQMKVLLDALRAASAPNGAATPAGCNDKAGPVVATPARAGEGVGDGSGAAAPARTDVSGGHGVGSGDRPVASGSVAPTARAEDIPQLLAGDFNTNSFRRGSAIRSAREFLRIVTSSEEALDRELREPYRREPLFTLLEQEGFDFRSLSDGEPTAEQLLGSAEDLDILPKPVRAWLARTFGLGTRVLRMRLDWIAARGWIALEAGTHSAATPEGPASDHALIHADLRLQ